MRRRGFARRGGIFAAVALLHAALIEILLADRGRGIPVPPEPSPAFRWVVVAPANRGARSRKESSRVSGATVEILPAMPVGPRPRLPAVVPDDAAVVDRPPPVDWSAELERGARAAAAASSSPARDFGFPHAPANATPGAAAFGWYHAGTHRVETLPEGGILVNLNDRCFVVFAPLPFPICRWGTIPVDGSLFDHLRDAPSPEVPGAPP